MLSRIWATVRTIYLVAVVAYTLWAMPWVNLTVARTFDETYARCAGAIVPLQRAAWLAIAWVALETVVGWFAVWRASTAAAKAAASAITAGAAPKQP